MNKNNTKSMLLLLKQFGFTDNTLSKIYENEDSILDVIFNPNYPFHNKYIDIYTKKEKEISKDINSLIEFHENFIKKMKEYKQKGIKIFCKYSDDYPEYLFNEENKPLFLYCYGNLALLKREYQKVAIIGTRKATDQGIIKTKKYVKGYVTNNWITISGLAKGIDTVVHKETIVNNGKTIAIIPTSFEKIYPTENTELFNEIVTNDGLIISMIGPYENTYKSNFLERNSIVAKISDEILVIEASVKSGTLNTVRKAYQFNKKIYYDSSLLSKDVIEYIKKYDAIDIYNKGEE
ncbi:DNA-processing protein DprA [Ectobacillus antri]|uniref:DNA-processing protein DprA n=1 Tax=Ectobacillus antri TaxID=2486280 RepID=A0ABT6H1N8_9BACI|nr:DNA-processing protein DprA [Ectobacillus antri]MDG4656409.1 DNA-processing protein DprA [Ectobacillus antri]MDG5753084.1 DNA-processing protein DprA [Ectobacillus antri]